ncbi:PhnD/SsuA/transferrin family substrate-binding protein [Amedibacterium intestinale]|uniref:PhnD/SsuA/transferrin family substrate-binding protein n=1 Tax=Amedibacterium intestinale TaxID=2583452 RepID=UPI000E204D78
MKKLMRLCMVAMLGLGVMTGCSEGKAKEEITIAFLPNETDSQASEAAYDMLKEEVQAALGDGVEVKVTPLDDYNAVAEAILTGTADIAWESGATFTSAYMQNENVVPILSYGPQGDPEKSGYNAYIGTNIKHKADFEGKSEEEKIAQLKGKSFSFVSSTSTSGCVVPTTTFWKLYGPDGTKELTSKDQITTKTNKEGGFFSEVQYGGDHQGSVELIANDKVYAGAYCCTYGDKYKDDLYVISQSFVPNGPMWVNKDYMDQVTIDKLVEHFTNLTSENAINKNFFNKDGGFFFEAEDDPSNYKFFKTDVDHYKFIIDMYKDQ